MSTRTGKNSAEERARAIEEESQKRRADAAAKRYKLEVIRKEREADERQAEAERVILEDTTPPSGPPAQPVNPFQALVDEPEQIAAVAMAIFEDENGADTDGAINRANNIKLKFIRDDIGFWLGQLEHKMRMIGIKSQWSKMQITAGLLPINIAQEIKHLLRVKENDETATATCYKRVKVHLIEVEPSVDNNYNCIAPSTTGGYSSLCKEFVYQINPPSTPI